MIQYFLLVAAVIRRAMLDVVPGRGVMLSGRSQQVRVLENFSVVFLNTSPINWPWTVDIYKPIAAQAHRLKKWMHS